MKRIFTLVIFCAAAFVYAQDAAPAQPAAKPAPAVKPATAPAQQQAAPAAVQPAPAVPAQQQAAPAAKPATAPAAAQSAPAAPVAKPAAAPAQQQATPAAQPAAAPVQQQATPVAQPAAVPAAVPVSPAGAFEEFETAAQPDSAEAAEEAPVAVEPEPAPEPVLELPAAPAKPRIAVYVTGGRDGAENRALSTYILDAFSASKYYTAIERSEMFLAEIDNEQVKQRSGAIDDSQISALGKQSGVGFVCVADIAAALRGFQISARILNVETAEVVSVGVVTSPLKTMDDLRKASAGVVEAMFRKLYPEDYKNAPLPEKRLKFGARLAYNNSFVRKFKFEDIDWTIDGEKYSIDYWNENGLGNSGVEISVVTHVGITETMWFNFSPGVVIRRPVATEVATISEIAMTVPAIFEWRLLKSVPLRLICGVYIDIPFVTEETRDGVSDPVEVADRVGMDFGFTAGMAYHITRNIALDLRGNIGLREFDGKPDHFMYQAIFGISYLY